MELARQIQIPGSSVAFSLNSLALAGNESKRRKTELPKTTPLFIKNARHLIDNEKSAEDHDHLECR